MKTPLSSFALAVFVWLALAPGQLHAQASKIFVASFGNDANDGSRGSTRRTFQAAHDAVADNGQIVVLDTAGYGQLTITKSLAVTVPPGVNGFVTVSGNNPGVFIKSPSSGTLVSLRGLIIEGGGGFAAGIVMNQGTLNLDDCIVRDFQDGVVIGANGQPGSVAILVARGVQVRNCGIGIRGFADSTGVGVILTDCAVNNCSSYGVQGLASDFPNTNLQMTLTRCALTANTTGIRSFGFFSTVYVDNCTLSNNATGLVTFSNGKIVTRGNNTFTNNYSGDGAFTGTLSAK